MIGHLQDALFEEMADLAREFHWPPDQLMTLTHHERRRWLREVERIRAQAAPEEVPWP